MSYEEDTSEIVESRSIIALSYTTTAIGLAWYNELSNQILVDTIPIVMEDMEEVFQAIKIDCEPSLFVLHSKIVSNTPLLHLIISKSHTHFTNDSNSVQSHLNAERNEGNVIKDVYEFITPKASTWRAESSLDLICGHLKIRSINKSNIPKTYYENYHLISSKIPLDSIPIQQALGSLLYYIQTNILLLDDEDVIISSIGEYRQQKLMKMDDHNFRSLQIFSSEIHPNLLKEQQHTKEGFSLFALLDRTNSLAGRQKLKEWMAKPFCNLESIHTRLNMIEILMNPQNKDFLTEASKLLRHMHNISKLLLRIKKVEATSLEWCKLHSSLEQGILLIRLCMGFIHDKDRNHSDRNHISKLTEDLDLEAINSIIRHLNNAINFKTSYDEGILTIRDGYDNILDNLRNKYDSLKSILSTAAREILNMVPLIPSINVEYYPQVGYLVAILDENGIFHRLLQDSTDENIADQFTFIYKQDHTYFYKHPIVYDLDERIGDITSDIKDRQKVLVVQMEDILLDMEAPLQNMALAFASLDAYISLTVIAMEMRFVQPQVVEANLIVIKNGRHPLQELSVETFISNDTFVNQEKNVALITGPNNSGKSVYVKQVGLIVYLAHIGSYVPCDRAIIGLTDQILTRISSIETISSPLSSFSQDLTQVSKMIAHATNRSLCILDEFGKGTTPIDGVSILAATLQYFIKLNTKTICALHFTEVLHDQILSKDELAKVNIFRMDVHSIATENNETIEFASLEDELLLAPLYKLCLGMAPSSEGILCAKAAGLSENVIDRAKQIKTAVKTKIAIKPLDAEHDKICQQHKELIEIFLSHEDWTNVDAVSDEVLQTLKLKLW